MDNDTPARSSTGELRSSLHPVAESIDATSCESSEGARPSRDAVALCVEGGGMREAYSGSLVCALAAEGLLDASFGVTLACGISAGSSVAANLVAHAGWRTRAMFVDAVTEKDFGGFRSLVRGQGYFNAEYLYEGCIEDGSYPFDYQAFCANPMDYACQALEAATGRTRIWQKRDFHDAVDMATHIRASSTMPMMMKPVVVNGYEMFDGGLGIGAGLPHTIAESLGYERFLVVRSRVAGYRKQPLSPALIDLYFAWAKDFPLVAKALMDRPARYNEELERLARLEAAGQALVITPDAMPLSSTTLSYQNLDRAWKAGATQGKREVDRVRSFLAG